MWVLQCSGLIFYLQRDSFTKTSYSTEERRNGKKIRRDERKKGGARGREEEEIERERVGGEGEGEIKETLGFILHIHNSAMSS